MCAACSPEPPPWLADLRAALPRALGPAPLADAVAQTAACALLAARLEHPARTRFTRACARGALPAEGAPGALVQHLASAALEPGLAAHVDAMAALLEAADDDELRAEFGGYGAHDEAGVHFYEAFLAAYDHAARHTRGVYYTPEPVASYIVRSADRLLRTSFGLAEGLAGAGEILDPAAGTGRFLLAAIDHVRASFPGDESAWRAHVSTRLLPRLRGIEISPAPHALSHANLLRRLRATGWTPAPGERPRLDLADALAAPPTVPRGPVVVLGNPPYAGHSANGGAWIAGLLRGEDGGGSYFAVDGAPLGEKNPKWLNDDYVKFVRLAQWCVARADGGVVGLVCNHGFLSHPTFRGMRHALWEAFDEIFVLDLHGSARRKERGPDGARDENVFDVQQGVCIALMVRRPGEGPRRARVRRADLWGTRAEKYAWMRAHDVATTAWTAVEPRGPLYLFAPEDAAVSEEYQRGWRLPELMPVHSVGVVTGRDGLAVALDEGALRERMESFLDPARGDDAVRAEYLRPRDRLDVGAARRALRDDPGWTRAIVRCLYRPFDERALLWHDAVVERTRRDVMQHLVTGDNVALVARRQMLPGQPCSYFGVARHAIVDGVIRSDNHGSESVFPLYVGAGEGRRANLAPAFVAACAARLGLRWVPVGRGDGAETFGPEDVLAYAYAVFHAPGYRTRYAEFLRRDFPRLPLPVGLARWRSLVERGARLVALHTMRAEVAPACALAGEGDGVVARVRWEGGRAWINRGQWFEPVPAEAWGWRMGAYAVCAKWLEGRKGRALSGEEAAHFGQVVAIATETSRVMGELEELWSPG